VVALVKTLERIMLSRIDAMITANDLILRNLNPSSKIPSVAIYNAPPLSILSISNQPINEVVSGLRHEFGADSFVLLYYGALRNYRGLDALLDAANLSRHLVDKKIVFLIVGDGPMESPLRYDVKRRGLRNVKFLPHMGFDMMMDLVKDVDAVYIGFEPEDPNNYFASPNKLFEAMAMRKPVVTSGFGLLGKIVQQIGCGVKLRSIEGRSIMAAIQKLFDQDFAKKCGENGQIAFRSFYNWDEMARRLESLYSTLQ
jgi:glycosyltransferase involved in cell wall biosynthesis